MHRWVPSECCPRRQARLLVHPAHPVWSLRACGYMNTTGIRKPGPQARRRLLLCLLAAVLFGPSCGGVNHEDYCREVCSGWEPQGIVAPTDCESRLLDDADDADVSGCGEEWDDWLTCADDEDYCILEESPAPEACNEQHEVYQECMSPSGAGCGGGTMSTTSWR